MVVVDEWWIGFGLERVGGMDVHVKHVTERNVLMEEGVIR